MPMKKKDYVEIDFQDARLPEAKPSGVYKTGRCYFIDAYFVNGKKIATFYTLQEAIIKTGISKAYINRSLFNDEYIGDIIFAFKGITFEDKVKAIKRSFRFLEYDLEGNFVRPWKFISEAAKAYNIKSNDILRCLNGARLTVAGRIFLHPAHSINARLFRINYKKKHGKAK